MHQTCLLASSQLLFQMQLVELIQSNQYLTWGWTIFITIVIGHPHTGEFSSLLGEEGCGFDSLEYSAQVEWLASTQPAPDSAVRQAPN